MRTFPRGGIHPSDNKLSRGTVIERLPLPEVVYVPLSQHLGAPAEAVVKKGDVVRTGQLIARASCFVSANVHAPISGVVESVDLRLNGQGKYQEMIVIRHLGFSGASSAMPNLSEEGGTLSTSRPPSRVVATKSAPRNSPNEVTEEWADGIDTSPELVRECTLTPEEILKKIEMAGLIGMGGAGFPTHVKLTIPPGKHVTLLLINGSECEPFLTCDHRVMLERGEELLIGVTLLMRVLGVDEARVGIENNKADAIAHLQALTREHEAYRGVRIVPLKVRYPQGGEKQLVAALTGRRTPPPPGLPVDVGCVVCNVSTAVAVYEAVQKGKPLVERVVTVSGRGLTQPKNLMVRVGTPVSVLLAAAGGLPSDQGSDGRVKVLNGGPMMGKAMSYMEAPVVKSMSGLTVMEGPSARRRQQGECIKCARCVGVCPMGLEPYLLMKLSRAGMWDRLEQEWMINCIECGCCQFGCPASIPLLDFIRLGKQEVRRRNKI